MNAPGKKPQSVGEVLDELDESRALATRDADLAHGVLSVIARAAADPNVDIDKLERLLQMQERVLAREARAKYTAALARMQPTLPVVGEHGGIKDRSGAIQSTYALWEDINDAIKPVLADHGFALAFKTRHEGDKVVVTGVLSHVDGHSEATELALPVDTSGSKNAVQAVGSSTSYGKRYTALALLNISTRGEDDDGRLGGGTGPITEDQWSELQRLADAAGADKIRLAKYLGVESLKELPARRFEDAKNAIAAKQRTAK